LRRIFKKGFRELKMTGDYFFIAFFISSAISIVLFILSITVGKEENIPGHWWSYVEEPRYYGMIHVFVQLGIFILYWGLRPINTRLARTLFIIMLIFLVPELIRGTFFTIKRVAHAKKEEYSWQQEKEIQSYADWIIRREKEKGEQTVITGSSYYINYRVGLYSHIPVFLSSNLLNEEKSLPTTKPALLLVILTEEDLAAYMPFMKKSEKDFAGYFRGYYFYAVHVTHDQQ